MALLILTVSAFNGCSGWRRPAGTYPGGSPDSTRPSPILTLAVPSLPQNLDPAMSSDRDTLRVISAVFDTLVRFRSDGTGFEPGLARDWNVDRDQKIWTFELRRGVKFHDGTDLNADAVVYSLTRLLPPARTPDMPLAAVFFDPAVIGAVEKDGEYSVKITLRRPYPALLSRLASPLPSAIISPAAHRADPAGLAVRPVGSGPFIFDRREATDVLRLRANPEYWMGRPATAQFEFRAIPESAARLQAAVSGLADAAFDLAPDEAVQVSAAENPAAKRLQLRQQPGGSLILLGFRTDRPPWNSSDARRAVAGAINRDSLAAEVFRGTAEPALGPVPAGFPGHDSDPAAYKFQGKSLRGRMPTVTDGTEGYRIELSANNTPQPFDPVPQRMAESLAAYLTKAGAQVRLTYSPWDDLLAQVWDPKKGGGAFLYGFRATGGDPGDFLVPLFHSAGTGAETAGKAAAGANPFGYSNPKADALLEEAGRESDEARRASLYAEVQRLIAADVPAAALVYPFETLVLRRDLNNLNWHAVGGLRLEEAWKPEP